MVHEGRDGFGIQLLPGAGGEEMAVVFVEGQRRGSPTLGESCDGQQQQLAARGHLANQFGGKNGLAQMALRMFREVDDQAADAGG